MVAVDMVEANSTQRVVGAEKEETTVRDSKRQQTRTGMHKKDDSSSDMENDRVCEDESVMDKEKQGVSCSIFFMLLAWVWNVTMYKLKVTMPD